MIIPEWKRILEGKEKFQDAEVETIANTIMTKMEESTDSLEIIELNNDLEQLMGKGEWLSRKKGRIEKLKGEKLDEAEIKTLEEKLSKVTQIRDEVVTKLKTKYGL